MKKKIILIAEDDRELVSVIVTLLRTRGYSYYVAYDGNTAYGILKKKPVDLALLDIKIPGIDGLTLCKMIKETPEWKSIPVIIITGVTKKSGKSDDYWAIRSGADDFITKPFDPLDLLKRIEEQLRIYEK